jgi:Ca-activated chloride channel family protein
MHTGPLGRTTWQDVVSFLGLAVLLGLAAGLLLGGMALLLAAPAYADNPADREGALLMMSARNGEAAFAAPLVSTDVVFQVSGPLVRARVVQTFENPQDEWLEAVYVFPLPENAAVDRMKLAAGERLLVGEIRERSEAKAVYAHARASGRRASLFDQERPNVFTTQVANIGPREKVVVEIEYQHTLRYDGNRFSLRFPMVVGPRYLPGGRRLVADAARITPPVLRPGWEEGRTNGVSIRVELDAGVPLGHVESAYHPVVVAAPSPSRRVVTLTGGAARADQDFELSWRLSDAAMPRAAWFVEERDGRHYGLLMLVPPALARKRPLSREVVFVLDTSGSMAGPSIRQAKEALAVALARLRPEDRFNVVEFNSTAQSLFTAPRDASEQNRRAAVRWVSALEARGGTEMAAALRLALAQESDRERLRQVVFLTDGAVGNEDELFGIIKERLGAARLFTVGIGSAPNGHFMTKAAHLGAGTFTFIGRVTEVGERMGALLAKLESPVMRNLDLRWPQGLHAEAWPARLPDLYSGEPLIVTAALDRLDGALAISGEHDGERWSTSVPIVRVTPASGVGALWARQKVASLMDTLRPGEAEAEAETRAQIVSLAVLHRLVTKYTSFVAVDASPVRPPSVDVLRTPVPTLLPAGWDYGKVFGELPQGATESRLSLLLGLICLLIAALAAVWARWRPV